MKRINSLLLVFLCLGASVCMRAEQYTIESVPSPKERGQEFYVSNPDSVLASETVAQLNQLLEQLDRTTEAELAVVAINEYANTYYSTYDFALDLFNHWGIGKADKNTGVLVLLAREARDIQIITGSGIEGILTDAECDRAIDAGFESLKENDFDRGMLQICQHLSDKLLSDDNRTELMFGWKPAEPDYGMSWAFIFGFLLMALLSWLAYKRLNGKPGQTVEDIQEQSKDLQTGTGCLAFLFPLPIFLFYLYYRYARKHVQPVPLNCPKCGQLMSLMTPELRKAGQLTRQQEAEERLKAYNFTVWHCPTCNVDETIKRKGIFFSRYEDCPECHAHAMQVTDRKTLLEPSYKADGKQQCTYTCHSCGHTMEKTIILDRLVRASSSSYSSGSGRSGGGYHSSHRSGSFGGGRSSGGGSGRHF